MDPSGAVDPTRTRHVVAMPYPGRGHINPMLNFCKVLAGKAQAHILITMVLTEDWLGLIGSDPKPDNLRFVAIPNVVPSELVRAADMAGFVEAVCTKIEAPFERLLDTGLLGPPPGLIVADTFLGWALRVGNRSNIPVASFWTMSSSMFSLFYHFRLLARNGHFPVNLQGQPLHLHVKQEQGEEIVDYIPGVSPTKVADLPQMMSGGKKSHIFQMLLEQFTFVSGAQYLLLPSVYELEPDAVAAIAPIFPFPVHTVGPTIPYFKLNISEPSSSSEQDVFRFLDQQPHGSVLYISFGSHQSIPTAQIDEIAAGLRIAGVRFLWVIRGDDAGRLREAGGDDAGLVVPWCDQLRVLCHCSVGGFLTHCGWSSVVEGLYAGVPFLTFPMIADQELNSKMIVEDWKVGLRMKKYGGAEGSVSSREEVAELVLRVMGLESEEGREMRKRGMDLRMVCRSAVAKNGSSETSIGSFLDGILDLV